MKPRFVLRSNTYAVNPNIFSEANDRRNHDLSDLRTPRLTRVNETQPETAPCVIFPLIAPERFAPLIDQFASPTILHSAQPPSASFLFAQRYPLTVSRRRPCSTGAA
jgi:hypothetical protein